MCIPSCVGLVVPVEDIVALESKAVIGASLMEVFRRFFLTTFLASLDGSIVCSVSGDGACSTTVVVMGAMGFGFG